MLLFDHLNGAAIISMEEQVKTLLGPGAVLAELRRQLAVQGPTGGRSISELSGAALAAGGG